MSLSKAPCVFSFRVVRGGVVPVRRPARGVSLDVVPDEIQRDVVADNVFVVVSLPKGHTSHAANAVDRVPQGPQEGPDAAAFPVAGSVGVCADGPLMPVPTAQPHTSPGCNPGNAALEMEAF